MFGRKSSERVGRGQEKGMWINRIYVCAKL